MTFDSNSNRNRFLKDTSRHRVGSKTVDIKPYIFNPEKAKQTGTAHLVIGKGQIKVTSESTLKAKEEEVKTSPTFLLNVPSLPVIYCARKNLIFCCYLLTRKSMILCSSSLSSAMNFCKNGPCNSDAK